MFIPKPGFSILPKKSWWPKKFIWVFLYTVMKNPQKTFGQANIRADLRQDKGGLCFRWHTSLFHGSSVQSLSCVWLFATPWTAAHQASLSITNPQSLLKLRSIESVIPSNHLILCHPLLLPPSILTSIRVFSNESVFHIRWPKQSSTKKKGTGKSVMVGSSRHLKATCDHTGTQQYWPPTC